MLQINSKHYCLLHVFAFSVEQSLAIEDMVKLQKKWAVWQNPSLKGFLNLGT